MCVMDTVLARKACRLYRCSVASTREMRWEVTATKQTGYCMHGTGTHNAVISPVAHALFQEARQDPARRSEPSVSAPWVRAACGRCDDAGWRRPSLGRCSASDSYAKTTTRGVRCGLCPAGDDCLALQHPAAAQDCRSVEHHSLLLSSPLCQPWPQTQSRRRGTRAIPQLPLSWKRGWRSDLSDAKVRTVVTSTFGWARVVSMMLCLVLSASGCPCETNCWTATCLYFTPECMAMSTGRAACETHRSSSERYHELPPSSQTTKSLSGPLSAGSSARVCIRPISSAEPSPAAIAPAPFYALSVFYSSSWYMIHATLESAGFSHTTSWVTLL